MKHLLALLLVLVAGCAPPNLYSRETWVERAYPGDFPEQIGTTWRTPTGIAVDGQANPHEIDWRVDEVFECLETAVPSGRVTKDEDRAGTCYKQSERFRYPRRQDIVVKIGDWHPSCSNPKRQVLDVEVKARGCDPSKPRPDGCPGTCYWRGGYRYVDGKHLHIAVPELSMLGDTLTRQITACRDPYAIERIRHCASWRRYPGDK